jgi:hypothetical protein
VCTKDNDIETQATFCTQKTTYLGIIVNSKAVVNLHRTATIRISKKLQPPSSTTSQLHICVSSIIIRLLIGLTGTVINRVRISILVLPIQVVGVILALQNVSLGECTNVGEEDSSAVSFATVVAGFEEFIGDLVLSLAVVKIVVAK